MARHEDTWKHSRPLEERNYPLNCWWVAAFSKDVNEDLIGKWLLDMPVVLFRDSKGDVIALEDRCPHRSAPLSKGCRRGDNVECIYHGFTFNTEGECVRVPSIQGDPPPFRVKKFPVIEQYPFVWIYLGDPEAIDNTPGPMDLEWADDESFALEAGHINLSGNYMLLKENVLDLTHFGFVHANSFKITDWVDPPKLVGTREQPGFLQRFENAPLPEIFTAPLGLKPGTALDRDNYGSFISPALQIAAVDLFEPNHAEGDQPVGRFRVVHATTPIDPTHTHYFWVIARDYGTTKEEMAAFRDITEVGFAEDEAVIEAVQATISRDLRDPTDIEVSVPADAPSMQARRALQKWLERETG